VQEPRVVRVPQEYRLRRTRLAALVLVTLASAATPGSGASPDPTFRVIVHLDVEGSEIRRQTLSSIFLREVNRWGTGRPVNPVDQSVRSPLRAAFTRDVLSRPMDGIQFYWAQKILKGITPPAVKETDDEVIQYVARTKGAVGYVSPAAAIPETVRMLTLID
jgi:ABC-type phosphate transport system substrate-binding protein